MQTLRAWQQQALDALEAHTGTDFLAVACVGAGKTTFALTAAARALAARQVDRIVIVVPTEHLKHQWADAAKTLGLLLDPDLGNDEILDRKRYDGYVTTYAQVAARPIIHERRATATRTFAVLDEIHHASDSASWGEGLREAFTPARKRLAVSGTPFRTRADEPIPFVRYEEDGDGQLRSIADYTYSYSQGLADQVVRPVIFAAWDGDASWVTSAGDLLSGTLQAGATKKDRRSAWRTVLDPKGQWVREVVRAMDEHLEMLRASTMPDAGALVLAADQDTARAYVDIIREVTGESAALAISDDPNASSVIDTFDAGTAKYLVSVRVVSEGVSINRLAVLGYLSNASTSMFFTQAVGRVVRARAAHETATVFVPATPDLLALAAEWETERDHVLAPSSSVLDDGQVDLLADGLERAEGTVSLTPVAAQAEFAHVMVGGRALTGEIPLTEEDADFVGLPGLLTAEQTATLLRARESQRRVEQRAERPAMVVHADPKVVRKEIASLVNKLSSRTGEPHATLHAKARSAVPGPTTAHADVDVLAARRDWLMGRVLAAS